MIINMFHRLRLRDEEGQALVEYALILALIAVFAIMIGGLSAVISGCMIFAVYGWKYVPTVYT